MRKLFTLTALALLLSTAANAQSFRKSWDFRKGFSSTTVANLQADMNQNGAEGATAHWRSYEKEGGTPGDQAFWSATTATVNTDGYAITTVDGTETVIPELEGLNVRGVKAKGFVIAHNWAQSENVESPNGLYTYGKSFLWLNGKSLTITVPKALKGETLKIGVESHKNTEARGINVSADGEKLTATSGNPTPKFFNEVVYNIPDDTPDVEDYAEITITTTNGCHIYYIIVGEGDAEVSRKVAYLYNSSAAGYTLESDIAYSRIAAMEAVEVTPIDVAGNISTITSESLQENDVVVLSSTIPADNGIVAVLKNALPWVPVLNMNASMYGAWGYGEAVSTESAVANVKAASSALFRDIEIILDDTDPDFKGLVFSEAQPITGVKPGEYFEGDDTLAVTQDFADVAAIHAHNITHNGYLYIPYSQEVLNAAYEPTLPIIENAVTMLASSKSKITKLVAPTVELDYKHLNTNVTLKSVNPRAKIYYTLNGSEPTEESTLYTGTFNLTEETTVKAVAIANGYLLSNPTEQLVEMKHQAATPVISYTPEDGQSIVSISCESPDVEIWYNYTGSTDVAKSSRFTDPVALKVTKTLTAFAVSDNFVKSEPATETIFIKNAKVRIDAIAHMDANPAEYNNGSTSTAYYFSWGKNKGEYPYYDETSTPIIETDSLGNETIVGYEQLNPEEVIDFGNGWKIVSRGHVMIWENIKSGKDFGVTSAYNPATVEDYDTLVTNYYINISEWNTAYPRNGVIATSVKHQGPFDIVSFVSNGSTGAPLVVFEVSADSVNWMQVGDTCTLGGQRLYRKITRSYEGTDEVYVRTRIADGNSKAGFYDIYIMTEGDKSKALEAEINEAYATGINEKPSVAERKETAIYNMNGIRINKMQRGLNIIRYSDGTTKKVILK